MADRAHEFVEQVALENTRQQMRAILDRRPILEHLFNDGKIGIVSAMYSVESGDVTFYDQQFHPTLAPAEAPTPKALTPA